MLTIGTLFAAVRTLTSNSPEAAINWATIHIYPVAHFWFVEAIFIIFLITLILEAIRILDRPLGVAVALTVSCGIYLTNVQIKIFALDGVAYLLPYFFAGMLVQRHFQSLIGQYKYALPILIAGVLCLTQLSQYQMSVETRMLPLALVASTLLCTSLLLIRIQHPFIARIGVYSYSIYIFHIFFTAASRIVLQKTGIEDKTIMFVIGLGAGLIGPIVAELVLKRTVITRKLLLGQR
jgi:peptidoglycan/LPS O-acetylase OafA/YrhL